MTTLNFCGFELDSTLEFTAATPTSGTFSIQGTTVRTGLWALRVNPETTAVGWVRFYKHAPQGADLNIATAYYRFYFRIATLPAANSEELFTVSGSSALKFALRINSSGNLMAFDNTGTNQLGSDGATELSTGVWYRIEVKVGTGTTADYEVKINGTSELSGTGDLTTSNNYSCRLGKQTNRNGQNIDFYYDDFCVDDSAYPGPGGCEVMQADGDGTYTTWSIGAGSGAEWEQVDEIPQDADTSYLTSTQTTNNAQTVTLESTTSANISGTIKAVKVFTVTRRNGTVTTVKTLLKSGASEDYSADFANSSFGAGAKIYETDPATSAAWTTSGLDSVEVGAAVGSSTSNTSRMTAVYLLVDFVGAVGGGPRSFGYIF